MCVVLFLLKETFTFLSNPCDRIQRKIAFGFRRLLLKAILQRTDPLFSSRIGSGQHILLSGDLHSGILQTLKFTFKMETLIFTFSTPPFCLPSQCVVTPSTEAPKPEAWVFHTSSSFQSPHLKPCLVCLLHAQRNYFPFHIFIVSTWVQPLLT